MAFPEPARQPAPRVRGAALRSHERRLADAHPKTASTGNAWAGDMVHDPRYTEAILRGASQAEMDRITDQIRPEYEAARVKDDWQRPHVSSLNARTGARAAEQRAAADAIWARDPEHHPRYVEAYVAGRFSELPRILEEVKAEIEAGKRGSQDGTGRVRC
jgi:hypothetical protein